MKDKLIVISPGYLHAAKEELNKYSFDICGYGSPDLAYKNIICVNKRNVLGCLIIFDVMDKALLKSLCSYLELYTEVFDRPVCICHTQPIPKTKAEHLNNRADIYYVETEEITDVSFNKAVRFILANEREAYTFTERKAYIPQTFPPFQPKKLITDDNSFILSPVNIRGSFEGTCKFDVVMQNYDLDKQLKELRKALIMTKCPKEMLSLNLIEATIAQLDKIIKSNPNMFVLLTSIHLLGELNDKL